MSDGTASSIFGPLPSEPRDKIREAMAVALWTSQAARRAAEDQANFFVNDKDWEAWRAYQLDQAEKRERAARDYQELLEMTS